MNRVVALLTAKQLMRETIQEAKVASVQNAAYLDPSPYGKGYDRE